MIRLRLLAALAIACGTFVVLAQPAHASPPDCTEHDKRDSTGIVRVGDEATITFTLDRDCTVSLWSYAQPGPRGALVDSAVASGRGIHTLTVRACAQVDFVPGPTHERGSGEAFTFETFDNDCEVPPSTSSTTSPSTSSTTSSSVPTTAPSVPSTSCVPDCENPDAPEHPQLAYGGAPEGAVPMALFGLAAILLGGAPLVWQGGKG